MNRRFGKFYIKADGQVFAVLQQLQFIPTRVELLAHMNAFEYIGMSYTFDEVPDYEIPPTYSVMVQDNGQVHVAKETRQ